MLVTHVICLIPHEALGLEFIHFFAHHCQDGLVLCLHMLNFVVQLSRLFSTGLIILNTC